MSTETKCIEIVPDLIKLTFTGGEFQKHVSVVKRILILPGSYLFISNILHYVWTHVVKADGAITNQPHSKMSEAEEESIQYINRSTLLILKKQWADTVRYFLK